MTRQDLILAVLERLNVVGVGQAPAAEDIATVGAAGSTASSPQLARRGAAYVQDADDLDAELIDPLATIVASACAPRLRPGAEPRRRHRGREHSARDAARRRRRPAPSAPIIEAARLRRVIPGLVEDPRPGQAQPADGRASPAMTVEMTHHDLES